MKLNREVTGIVFPAQRYVGSTSWACAAGLVRPCWQPVVDLSDPVRSQSRAAMLGAAWSDALRCAIFCFRKRTMQECIVDPSTRTPGITLEGLTVAAVKQAMEYGKAE